MDNRNQSIDKTSSRFEIFGVYGEAIKSNVIDPDFFICGDYGRRITIGDADCVWRMFWGDLAKDIKQDIYVVWVTARGPQGGVHHHAIVKFEDVDKIRGSKRRIGKLARLYGATGEELINIATVRWEKGYAKNRDIRELKRTKNGSMSCRRYNDERLGAEYLAKHIATWKMGDESGAGWSVGDGRMEDAVFCGHSHRCRRHHKKTGKCYNDVDGRMWKRNR